MIATRGRPTRRQTAGLSRVINPGWTPGTVKPEMYDEQVRGTSSIIAAARKAGIKRVLWVGGAGGLEVAPGVQSIDAPRLRQRTLPAVLRWPWRAQVLRSHPTPLSSSALPGDRIRRRTAPLPLGQLQPDARAWIARTPGNTIRKVYLCRAKIARLRPGDLALFYTLSLAPLASFDRWRGRSTAGPSH